MRMLWALWGAFYSTQLYRDVVFRWKGIGVLYLTLLLAITWMPSAGRWFEAMQDFDGPEAHALVAKLPTVTIKDGVMSADPPGRHVIPVENETTGETEAVVIIDDRVDTIVENATTESFVVTRHEAGVIRPGRGERRVWQLARVGDMEITQADVLAFLGSLAAVLAPVGYLGAVAGSLIFRVTQAFVYGLAAIAYARRKGLTLSQSAAMRLAAVAVTPVIILRTLVWIVNYEPAWYIRWPIGLLIAAFYITFGIKACLDARQPDTQSAVQV
jgi:hypothetical protein